MRKPGMAKYASFRGPGRYDPRDKQIDFWSQDVKRCEKHLAQAIETGNQTDIRRERRWLKAAQAELARASALPV